MITIENKWLYAEFEPRGAAVSRLLFKPFGRDVLRQYLKREVPHHYTNTVVGPIANRIHQGKFKIGQRVFILQQNEGTTTLHGGEYGVSELNWSLHHQDETSVTFRLALPDKHMGFPGAAEFFANYTVEENSLYILFRAKVEQNAAISLAPHLYFNLNGEGTIDTHKLYINASHFLPVDKQNMPTGEILAVKDTIFDFLDPRPLCDKHLDHNFCLEQTKHNAPALTLIAKDMKMNLFTDQLGIQIYDGRHIGREHVAIEPQHWPNAVNMAHFPSPFVAANTWQTAHSQFTFSQQV